MYIIEKILKLYLKIKQDRNKNILPPIQEGEPELEDVITCEHNFMPIDSTGDILACSKCGYVINKKRLKKSN